MTKVILMMTTMMMMSDDEDDGDGDDDDDDPRVLLQLKAAMSVGRTSHFEFSIKGVSSCLLAA